MKKLFKKITFFEKFMLVITFLLVVSYPVMSIFAKSELSTSNYKVEMIKEKVKEKEKENESIQMTINQLASLENMESIAKSEGLSYTSNSIKVID